MARQARVIIPGAAHHVTQRGNYQQDLFFTDDDRLAYLRYLRESAQQFGLSVEAYCLMTNHVHLVVVPEQESSLSKALGRAHLLYAQYVHRLHGRLGHFWQSRFYSCPMDEAHTWNATAYVELNPVRARMTKKPWEYPWSSAAAHCGKGADPSGLLDLPAWREQFTPRDWRRTLDKVSESDPLHERLRIHCRTGRPLGDDAFLSKVEALLGRRLRPQQGGRPKGSKDRTKRKPRHAA